MLRAFLFIIVLLLTCDVFATQQIRISTSEWPPYVSKTAPNYGYISHIVSEAFAKVNVEVEFVFSPWARAYDDTKDGEFSASSYWYKDPKHAEHFYFSEPLNKEKVTFFRLKSNKPITWQSVNDFDDYTIGLTRSYTYTKELWQYADKNQERISIVNTDEQNLKMLLLGRIDITPVQEDVGWHYLQSMFAKGQVNRVETLQPPLSIKTGHLLFPKAKDGSKELVEIFNRGLKILEASGRLATLQEELILGKYSN